MTKVNYGCIAKITYLKIGITRARCGGGSARNGNLDCVFLISDLSEVRLHCPTFNID